MPGAWRRNRLGGKVAVVGVGYSELPRRTTRSAASLTLDAIRAALDDAGLTMDDVDGMATYPEIPVFGNPHVDGVDVVSVHYVSRLLGLTDRLRWHVQTDSLVPNTFIEGVHAVAAGACDVCVVFRTMHNPSTPGTYNAFTADRAPGNSQFTAPYGVHRGYQYFGSAYRRYMWKYGATREQMATLIVNNRVQAARNPVAYFRDQPLTVDDYLGARMIAEPVCLLDCDLPVDGAVALVLVNAERAHDGPGAPAWVAGSSQYVGAAGGFVGKQLTLGPPLEHIQEGAAPMGTILWETTGRRASDVKVAEMYDGYSFFVYWWLEALGLCGKGEAASFIQDGRIAQTGALPLNTFGGQLGEGRLHGIGHIAEAARQAAGRAGDRQVADADVVLAGVGPLVDGSAAILFTREPG
jgi:acetyl-CoA acetyltransferase